MRVLFLDGGHGGQCQVKQDPGAPLQQGGGAGGAGGGRMEGEAALGLEGGAGGSIFFVSTTRLGLDGSNSNSSSSSSSSSRGSRRFRRGTTKAEGGDQNQLKDANSTVSTVSDVVGLEASSPLEAARWCQAIAGKNTVNTGDTVNTVI